MVDLRVIWVHENLSRDNVRKKNPNGWKNNNKEQPAKVVVAKRTREVKTIEAFHGCRFKKLSLAFLHIKGSSKKIKLIIMFLLSFFLRLCFSRVILLICSHNVPNLIMATCITEGKGLGFQIPWPVNKYDFFVFSPSKNNERIFENWRA
jgi:hypothetical protein